MYSYNLYPAGIKTIYGTKWGYINNKGDFIIIPQYQRAREFQANGLAIVEKEDLWGIIDTSGEYVVYPQFEGIMDFSEGRALVIVEGGFKVIDEKGNILTKRAYNYIDPYQNGRALASITNTEGYSSYGYLDLQGQEIIPTIYDMGYPFKNGKAIVKISENKFALINKQGDILYAYNYPMVGNLGNGLLAFQRELGGKYGYIDIKGNEVIPLKYSSAQPFSKGRGIVNISEDVFYNKYGLIDKEGNFIIEPQYNDIYMLGENRAAIGKAKVETEPYMGSKYAIADILTGDILTGFVYNNISPYNRNYASVSNDTMTFFIDTKGLPSYSLPIVKGSGELSFIGDLIKANIDQKLFYLNKEGDIIWHPNYIIPLNDQFQIFEKKHKPNKDYLVYYPQIRGMKNEDTQKEVNNRLKELSKVIPIDNEKQLDYSYTGTFSVEFFKCHLLVLKLEAYNYTFGAAHGMPSQVFPHIDLISGEFYQLEDLFKEDSNYVKVLSDVISYQIENDPDYSYVFPGSFEEISKDQPFYVNEDALYIYFEPYEIGPYVAGFPTFRIPFNEIYEIINTEGDFWQAFNSCK
ncbi:WG repeat-containing protein [Clostridium sp. D2Q-11]|uniref:WG repeat-containing protein n=1 Tax=Anaeromonas frigoriresistens TaxID=2683708 RepID=A0A942UT90_9FIRM|nr:WG repeat-containing protein [Anaeromonas frigoriresistens]MBS4538153.1 WG repeat-containing protein [Anaeromonas frigoriresistens]